MRWKHEIRSDIESSYDLVYLAALKVRFSKLGCGTSTLDRRSEVKGKLSRIQWIMISKYNGLQNRIYDTLLLAVL